MTTETLCIATSALRLQVTGFWERILRLTRHRPKRLKLCESLPLGERRFVAVVEFDAERFLVGGTSSSLVLLSRLSASSGREQEEGDSQNTRWTSRADQKRRGESC